jgi:pilus assembly protein CpaC
VLQGFRIPALNTRRAETDVELRDGQSFAIAGLLNNLTQTDRQNVPILSRIPIIGTLFKSRSLRADQTELMVLVTPRLVQALDPDEVPALPVRPGAFLNPSDDENESMPGEPPDESTTPSIRDTPRRPPPPGTVKPRPPGGGGPHDRR